MPNCLSFLKPKSLLLGVCVALLSLVLPPASNAQTPVVITTSAPAAVNVTPPSTAVDAHPKETAPKSPQAASNDPEYWVNQLAGARKDAIALQATIADLRRQIDALSVTDLRQELAANQAFTDELRRLRSEAGRFIDPELIPPLDWAAKSAADKGEELKRKLEAQQRESSATLAALQLQLNARETALSHNSDVQHVLSTIIEAQRTGYDRISRINELKVLESSGSAQDARNPKP